jgi:hypothetical protein
MSRQKFIVSAGLLLEYSIDHDINDEALSEGESKTATDIIRKEMKEAMSRIENKLSDIEGVEFQFSDLEYIDTEAGEEC